MSFIMISGKETYNIFSMLIFHYVANAICIPLKQILHFQPFSEQDRLSTTPHACRQGSRRGDQSQVLTIVGDIQPLAPNLYILHYYLNRSIDIVLRSKCMHAGKVQLSIHGRPWSSHQNIPDWTLIFQFPCSRACRADTDTAV